MQLSVEPQFSGDQESSHKTQAPAVDETAGARDSEVSSIQIASGLYQKNRSEPNSPEQHA